MMQYISTALAILALVVIAVFSIQNLTAVEVSFLTWSVSVSQIVVILGSYVLGMLTGGTLWHLIKKYFQKSKENKAKLKEARAKEATLG